MTTTATHAPVDPSRTTGTDTNATTTSPRKSGLYDDAFAYGPHLASTGVTFDVISVDAPLGLAALRLLRERKVPLGAVIHDQRWDRIGYLVPSRSDEPVSDVELRCGPRQIGLGSWVVLPAGDSEAMVTWLQPPAVTDQIVDHLTPTRIVREALREAAALGEVEPQT